MKKAIVFGASGFVGSYLLDGLLNNAAYELVTVVVRKDLNIQHPKLKTLIGDFNNLHDFEQDLAVDEIFIAIGTTKKLTPNQQLYYQIDHDYPVLAAKMAKANEATAIFVVSAVGANAKSNIFYVKTKGETERDIIALDFKHTHIFRPSMIMGSRKESRPLEKKLIKIWKFINPIFIGSLSKYRGITASDIAKAIINAAANQTEKVKIYEWKEMKALL